MLLFLLLAVLHAHSAQETAKSLFYQFTVQQPDDTEKICRKLKDSPKSTPEDIYYTKQLAAALEDCSVDIPNIHADKDDFFTFYYTSLSSIKFDSNLQPCDQLSFFVSKGGSAKLHRKKPEDSYKTATFLYSLAAACGTLEDFSPHVQEAIYNLQEIYLDTIAILDRENTLALTAKFLSVVLDLNHTRFHEDVAKKLKDEVYQLCLVNFIYKESLRIAKHSYETQFYVEKLLSHPSLADFVFPVVAEMHTAKQPINIKFQNLRSQNLLVVDPQHFSTESYTPLPKSKEFHGQVTVQSVGPTKLIFVFANYRVTAQTRMLKQLKIDELMFSIVHSKTEKPSFKYSAEEGELYPLVLEATEKSYLHIVFKILPTFAADQVAVRLVHPNFSYTTTQVVAEYNQKKNLYYAIIDFGDPDHMIPISGKYSVELLIADPYYEPKRWTFAQVNCKQATQAVPWTDSYYKLEPEIAHQFSPEQPEVPFSV